MAQNITYTPWGALTSRTNGCVGTGCTNALETYDYNNRMQPVRLQLGIPGNTDQEYCLVYNYYTSLVNSPPSSCAVPSQGSGNNGSVINIFDLDGPNNTLMTHTETYTYDNVNRLATAAASRHGQCHLQPDFQLHAGRLKRQLRQHDVRRQRQHAGPVSEVYF